MTRNLVIKVFFLALISRGVGGGGIFSHKDIVGKKYLA